MARSSYDIKLAQMIGSIDSSDCATQLIPEQVTNCFYGPSILTFSGNDAHDLRSARGFAKRATRLAGIFGYSEVNVFGCFYSGQTDSEYVRTYNTNCRWPENYGTGALRFTENYLLSLVTRPNGEKLPIALAKKNLRNLNILTASFGGVAIEEIGNAFVELMEKLKFSKDEITELTKQVVVIKIGSRATLGAGKASFSRISVFNMYDRYLGDDSVCQSPNDTVGFKLSNIIHNAEKTGSEVAIIKYSENETIVAVNYDLSGFARFARDKTFFMERTDGKGWTESNYIKDSSNHNPDLLLVPGISRREIGKRNGFFIPAIISNILSSAIQNSVQNASDQSNFHEIPRIQEMVVDTHSRAGTTETRRLLTRYTNQGNNFRDRIMRALAKPLSLS